MSLHRIPQVYLCRSPISKSWSGQPYNRVKFKRGSNTGWVSIRTKQGQVLLNKTGPGDDPNVMRILNLGT